MAERVYRERRPVTYWPAMGVALGGVLAGLVVVIVAGRWGVVAGVAATVAGVLAGGALVWWSPVAGASGRRWLVVGEQGVTIRDRRAGVHAYPWPSVGSFERVPAGGAYGWKLVMAGGEPVFFNHFGDAGSLAAAVRARRAPVAAPVGRYALAGTAAVVVLGLLVWFVVVPRFRTEHRDALPAGLDGFAPVCDAPGVAFDRAAPYAGSPHPAVVFDDEFTRRSRARVGTLPRDGTTVENAQVAVCARRRALDTSRLCVGGRADGLPTARYDVTVYEIRTHRMLAHRELAGDCGGGEAQRVTAFFAGISLDQYARDLADVLGG